MSGSIFRFLLGEEGLRVPSAEGAMLRVPKDTLDEDRQRALATMRAAREFLEAKPRRKPYVPPGRPTISLSPAEFTY